MAVLSQGSSSSSSTHDYRFDVFLSFRGFDTRNSFTDHLHSALVNANIETFLDDEEIQPGGELKPELETAIKSSRASIIVLSENYASSTWCLDELVLILEQHNDSDHIVIPVFYHVEPTHVRKQQSSFGDAMAKHKQRMEAETDAEKRSRWAQKMELWTKALVQVADLKGKDAKGRKETEFIEEIVMDIHHLLGVPLRTKLPFLIGMEYSIELITLWLKDGSSHNADIFTILGMGGMGKTSLAKYVYGLHCRMFKRSSFIEDIGRRYADQINGLLDLQKQLYRDISKACPIHVHDVSYYTSMIQNVLARTKVLLVLDNIDRLEQLDALLGKEGFHPGSKIIITTKDASLIKRCALFNLKVQPRHTKRVLRGLDEAKSLELLSFHAFKCHNPNEGYEKVSEKLVRYCQGHPLTLVVLGKYLRDQDVLVWKDCIEGLKKEPNSQVKVVLRMSFDSLQSDNDKELFKHIACFFVGKDKETTETILNACGIQTVTGIKNLTDRCLISIGWNNKLMMHQLLQDMGRDVVRQESVNKPWKRSRLWCHEDSFKVLKQRQGKGNILGLILDMKILEKEKLHGSVELKTDALHKMYNLMLLQLNYVQLNGSYENFPQELRWLCMHGFPLKYIPSNLPMENVVVLDMSYSNIKSFDVSTSDPQQPTKRQKLIGSCSKDKRLLESLKILDLSHCYDLCSIGGFLELPALERLILTNCTSLIDVCESIEQCDELVFIDLSYCNEFRKILSTINKLKKVKTLSLDGCNIGKFPSKIRESESVEKLNVNRTGVNPNTSSSVIVEAIPRDLNSFPISLPSSLVILSLANSNLSNESFPKDLSCLSMLKKLFLDGNPIVSLPNCVRYLPRLEILSILKCKMLKTIEHPPCTILRLILEQRNSVQKVLFDPKMPILFVSLQMYYLFVHSSFEIEGIVKMQPMVNVEEDVLRSLGWTNLESIKKQQVDSWHAYRGRQKSHVQMYYEFGIFSTIYTGKEIPNWISQRSNGASISFTIPSSLNKLRGLNFCYVQEFPDQHAYFRLPLIKVCNITKSLTWIYSHYGGSVKLAEECLIFLSHWMFEKNEMEDGDQIRITLREQPNQLTRECGISLVYDDGNMTEDPLGYYKSWNHIIGKDLSTFQSNTGIYILRNLHMMGGNNDPRLFLLSLSPGQNRLPYYLSF